MELSLDELGMEMYQEDGELVWEIELPTDQAMLRLSQEDLERLIYRLSDELHLMLGYDLDDDEDETLPEGTELMPDSGDEIVSALDSFDDDDVDFDEE